MSQYTIYKYFLQSVSLVKYIKYINGTINRDINYIFHNILKLFGKKMHIKNGKEIQKEIRNRHYLLPYKNINERLSDIVHQESFNWF